MAAKKKREIKTRNYLIVLLINGVTKSGTHKDKKKDANKKKCRNQLDKED